MGEGGNTVGDSPVETASLERVEALLEAARYDDMDDLKSLESAGVSLDSKDLHGRTALHMTSANGHLQIVEYLISRGVDLNATNEEMNTPLHWACLNGHVEVVKKLILAGANLSVLNSYERTPVDEAVSRGKMDVLDAVNAAAAQVKLREVHKYANEWRDRPFPRFERFLHIFGQDRATGKTTLALSEMVMDDDDDDDDEELDASETNIGIGLEGSHQTKVATQAHSGSSFASTSRKRERPNKILDGLGKIANVLKNMVGVMILKC